MILYPKSERAYYQDSLEERQKLRGVIDEAGHIIQLVRCPYL